MLLGLQSAMFRYRHAVARLRPGILSDIAFWISLAAIAFVVVRTVASLFS